MNRKQQIIFSVLLLTAIVLTLYLAKPRTAKSIPESVATPAAPAAGASRSAEVPSLAKPQLATRPGVQPKINQQQKALAEDDLISPPEDQNYFLGRWCNNELWKENNEYFALEFLLSENGEVKAVFHNNGPFSQTLRADVAGRVADLYFESVEGSMSFNEAAIKYDAKDCTERVASATILDENSLQISNFNDVCGYMSAATDTLSLTKLQDGETCIPE